MSLSPLSSFKAQNPVSWYSSDNPDSDDSSSTRLTLSPENIRTPNPNEPALRKLGFSAIAKLGRDLLWNLGSLFVLTHHHAAKWIPFTTNAVLQDPENPLAGILLQWPSMVTIQGNPSPAEYRGESSYTWDLSLFRFCGQHRRWEKREHATQTQYEHPPSGSTLKIYDPENPTRPIEHFTSSNATRIVETPLRKQLLISGFKQIRENVYVFTDGETPTRSETLIAVIEPWYSMYDDLEEDLMLLFPEDEEHALIMGGLRNHRRHLSHLGLDDLSEPGTIQPTFQLQPNKKSKSLHLKSLMTPQTTLLSSIQYPSQTPAHNPSEQAQCQNPTNSTVSSPTTQMTPSHALLPSAEDAKISPIQPHCIEGQSFIIGGTNSCEVFLSLRKTDRIGLHSINTHEFCMKKPFITDYPGYSWLNINENLIDRLAADTIVGVSFNGLLHQQIGIVLEYFIRTHESGYLGIIYGPYCFTTTTRPLTRKYPSPFSEKGMDFQNELTITRQNLMNPQEPSMTIKMCRLSPYLIQAWGFYGGESCPWRVNPPEVVRMFNLKGPAGKRLMQSIGIAPPDASYTPLICQIIIYDGNKYIRIGG